MTFQRSTIIAATVVVAGVALMVAAPPRLRNVRVQLHGSFVHDQGFAYVASVPSASVSDAESPGASSISLFEDDRALGPAHSPHPSVVAHGSGTFLHWKGIVFFSPSDNSNPNDNGHHYFVEMPGLPLPTAAYLVTILSTYLATSCLLHQVHRVWRSWLRLWNPIIHLGDVILAALFIQCTFAVLIPARLAEQGQDIQRRYAETFANAAVESQLDSSLHFIQHHYLNYSRNPDALDGDSSQVNRAFLVRRTEEVRPRSQVKWRALILGGSTTFGEGIRREEDTWVYQLERLIRARYGEDVDVINGGMGGYTIAENFIHYITLLTHLEPDLVLLYTGINDVHPRLFGKIAYDYSNYRVPWRNGGSVLPLVERRLSWLYPYRYFFLTNKIVPLRTIGIDAVVSRPYPDPSQWKSALERNGPGIYDGYLVNLVLLLLG
jgi:hypothetical protein